MAQLIDVCPFCGVNHTHISHHLLTFFVVCQHCNSSGPRHRNADGAIKDWNSLSQVHKKAQFLTEQTERMQTLLGRLYQIESDVWQIVHDSSN